MGWVAAYYIIYEARCAAERGKSATGAGKAAGRRGLRGADGGAGIAGVAAERLAAGHNNRLIAAGFGVAEKYHIDSAISWRGRWHCWRDVG